MKQTRKTKPSPRNIQQRTMLAAPTLNPGSVRLRARIVAQVRQEMEYFYKSAHLSELFLLNHSLLIAEGERSSKNTTDDCSIGNAVGECLGMAGFKPIEAANTYASRRAA